MKDAVIFWVEKKNRGIILGCEKRTEGFFLGIPRIEVIFLGKQILKL